SAPDSALPPPGTRIIPIFAAVMANITGPAAAASSVISTEQGAHHYRFIGIEITASSPDPTWIYNMIWLDGYPNQTTVAQEPHHIIFDRVYAHGRPMQNIRR